MSVYQELAEELVRTRRIAETRGAPQLINSTIEGGAVPIRDDSGQLTAIVGEAFDGSFGSFTLAGPNPPTPSTPEVTQIAGGATVRILGTWENALVAPMDFARWEIYASTEPVPSAIFTNFKTDLTSPRGGELGISLERDTDYWIWITARSTSGKIGAPSAMVGPVRAGKMVESDLDVDWSKFGGNSITPSETMPTGEHSYGDLWLKLPENVVYRWAPGTGDVPDAWLKSQDQSVADAVLAAEAAQAASLLGARLFVQAARPANLLPTEKGIWVDTDDDHVSYTWTGDDWVKRQISNGAILPNSLVASDIIATGTVSAALLEALIVLATTIIAGDPAANHVEINQDGMRVFIADPVDGIPNEVIRLGTSTGDILGVTDRFGRLVMSVDDTGRVSGQEGYFNKVVIGGRDFDEAIASTGGRPVGRFRGNLGFNQPKVYVDPYGVAEVGVALEAGRTYRIDYRFGFWPDTGGDEYMVHMIYSMGAAGDTATQAPPIVAKNAVSNALISKWYFTQAVENRLTEASGIGTFTPTRTTRYRIGVALQRNTPGSTFGTATIANQTVEIIVTDMGPAVPMTGGFTNMGGTLLNPSTPPPAPPADVTQRYFVDLAPAGRASYNGAGQLMTWVGNDVYQGYHSSNGNTSGQFWFNLPTITGTVDGVVLYAYFRHWYYNSGGTVRLGLTDQRAQFTRHSFKTILESPGWPKPGAREIFLPADWWPLFRGNNNFALNGRATAITLGPGNGTNPLFYGVCTDMRLRISYTQ